MNHHQPSTFYPATKHTKKHPLDHVLNPTLFLLGKGLKKSPLQPTLNFTSQKKAKKSAKGFYLSKGLDALKTMLLATTVIFLTACEHENSRVMTDETVKISDDLSYQTIGEDDKGCVMYRAQSNTKATFQAILYQNNQGRFSMSRANCYQKDSEKDNKKTESDGLFIEISVTESVN